MEGGLGVNRMWMGGEIGGEYRKLGDSRGVGWGGGGVDRRDWGMMERRG